MGAYDDWGSQNDSMRRCLEMLTVMPVIACFFGIYVRMYFDDHGPPHFHVEYQGHEALVGIASGEVFSGSLPRRAARLVQEWGLQHQAELMEDWRRASNLEPLLRIPGADND